MILTRTRVVRSQPKPTLVFSLSRPLSLPLSLPTSKARIGLQNRNMMQTPSSPASTSSFPPLRSPTTAQAQQRRHHRKRESGDAQTKKPRKRANNNNNNTTLDDQVSDSQRKITAMFRFALPTPTPPPPPPPACAHHQVTPASTTPLPPSAPPPPDLAPDLLSPASTVPTTTVKSNLDFFDRLHHLARCDLVEFPNAKANGATTGSANTCVLAASYALDSIAHLESQTRSENRLFLCQFLATRFMTPWQWRHFVNGHGKVDPSGDFTATAVPPAANSAEVDTIRSSWEREFRVSRDADFMIAPPRGKGNPNFCRATPASILRVWDACRKEFMERHPDLPDPETTWKFIAKSNSATDPPNSHTMLACPGFTLDTVPAGNMSFKLNVGKHGPTASIMGCPDRTLAWYMVAIICVASQIAIEDDVEIRSKFKSIDVTRAETSVFNAVMTYKFAYAGSQLTMWTMVHLLTLTEWTDTWYNGELVHFRPVRGVPELRGPETWKIRLSITNPHDPSLVGEFDVPGCYNMGSICFRAVPVHDFGVCLLIARRMTLILDTLESFSPEERFAYAEKIGALHRTTGE